LENNQSFRESANLHEYLFATSGVSTDCKFGHHCLSSINLHLLMIDFSLILFPSSFCCNFDGIFAALQVFHHGIIHQSFTASWAIELQNLQEVLNSPMHIDGNRPLSALRTAPFALPNLLTNARTAEQNAAADVGALSAIKDYAGAQFADEVMQYWSQVCGPEVAVCDHAFH
jgi:hypothetical protein